MDDASWNKPSVDDERATTIQSLDVDGAADAPAESSTRRTFLRRASALTLAIPGLGAALESCSSRETGRSATSDTTEHETHAGTTGTRRDSLRFHNPDSKLDTSLKRGTPHGLSGTRPPSAAASAVYARFDPRLPPLPGERSLKLHFHAREVPVRISPDTVVAGWTFEGNIPGPLLHCRVGDTVHFTLTNEAEIPHSMDFHAAQIDPRTAFRSAMKGQSVSYQFTPRRAGAFCYHCGTAPVLMHIGAGMFGAIVVSPRTPLPPAREFVLLQNGYYLGQEAAGTRPSDYQKMLGGNPDIVTFNGRPDQYSREPIRVKRGDRVRFWVVNPGPTMDCAFHIVGEQFDTVYIGEPPTQRVRGVQTWSVPAGGGMGFELTCDIAGEFVFVNHAFGHGQKGAIGTLVVEA
ncbi:MAG TPA: multicopper oxidase domain-containing protein [Gemmatimonadaceae bacterium]|jgi:nitrite reductase (NO-forming)|nr:multicopper oxidase domain-containing protein [Gemmatimonadaceae bacterium]